MDELSQTCDMKCCGRPAGVLTGTLPVECDICSSNYETGDYGRNILRWLPWLRYIYAASAHANAVEFSAIISGFEEMGGLSGRDGAIFPGQSHARFGPQ